MTDHAASPHGARTTAAQLAALHAALREHADPVRAAQTKRYLKSDLSFMGVTVPVLRATAKRFVREQPQLDHAGLWRLTRALWRSDVHELRACAVALLELERGLLSAADLPRLVALVRGAKTWALVDWLAVKVIGPLVDGRQARAHVDVWAGDPDFWVRRAALLCHHDALLRGGGDFEHFARLAEPLLADPEFFIRKAIGWMLRAAARRTPERTYGFVEAHAATLSGLSFREALRALPMSQQRRLLALRAAGTAEGARSRARAPAASATTSRSARKTDTPRRRSPRRSAQGTSSA